MAPVCLPIISFPVFVSTCLQTLFDNSEIIPVFFELLKGSFTNDVTKIWTFFNPFPYYLTSPEKISVELVDRQTDKLFDTKYLGVQFFLSVKFATCLLALLAGDKKKLVVEIGLNF